MKQAVTRGFWLSLWAGLLAGGTAWAKPADLPAVDPIECQAAATQQPDPAEESAAPPIDASLPPFVEQWLQHVGDLLARPDRVMNLETIVNKLPRFSTPEAAPGERRSRSSDEPVQHLFAIAEIYRLAGRYESARYYYQRVHLLAPTSRTGRLAIERLQQVEEQMREDAEEQSHQAPPAQPQSRERDKDDLMPLGLVRNLY